MATRRLPLLPTISEIIRLYRLRALRQLSQNFLLDSNLCDKIIRQAGPLEGIHVCEVGPGPGGLTRSIIKQGASELVVVEKDNRFLPMLQHLAEEAPTDLMKIIHGDITTYKIEKTFSPELRKPWDEDPPNIYIIGNLPFNVSTYLALKWFESMRTRTGPFYYGRTKLLLTFQKEVAQRLTAMPGNEMRGRLSVMCQHVCKPELCFTIPGNAFLPKAKVDVSVVRMTPLVEPRIQVPFDTLEKVTRCTLHNKRKFIRQGVQKLFPLERNDLVEEVFEVSGVDPEKRSFELSVTDFGELSNVYHTICEREPILKQYEYR